MPTFLQMQTRLLTAVNRPISEADVLAGAKEAINDAISSLQRDHAFHYTEKLASITYPANSLSVDLGTVCGGTLRDVLSIQQLSAGGTYEGKPLKIMSYGQLQAMRRRYDRSHSIDSAEVYAENVVGLTIEDGYRQDQLAFLTGQNIGIYPRPSADTSFIVNIHIWLPELSADADTNFFLTYGADIVFMKALKRLFIIMKNTTNFPFSEQEVKDAIDSLNAWDAQVGETTGTAP